MKTYYEHCKEMLDHPNMNTKDRVHWKLKWFVENANISKQEAARALLMTHLENAVGLGDVIESREGVAEFDEDYIRELLVII